MNYGGLLVGLALAIAVALLAYRIGALDRGGAAAAVVAGTLAVAAGWSWAIVLIAYFLSSSALSRYRSAEKDARAAGLTEKHGARDAIQVIANGGAFSVMALGYLVRPDPAWQVLAAGALAASASDTWATEIGVLARQTPRSIITGRPVPIGTSGGVTLEGWVGAAAGATLVAATAMLVGWPAMAGVSAIVGGILGCLLDSLLGATVQARRWCTSCGSATEQRIHRCGAVTDHTGGIGWLDNDGVNVIATLGGALVGAITATFFDA